MKRKGISLIVLIITIVVIIILAAAIILNLSNTNLIENANEAVLKQNLKTYQDELTLYIADQYAKKLGEFKTEDLDGKPIKDIIPSIEGTVYKDYLEIKNGKLAVASDATQDQIKEWITEALEEKEVLTEPEEISNVALDNTKGIKNKSITGGNFVSTNPVIPVGFKAINTNEASWADANNDGIVDGWNDGLVIQDERGNEFVWVPCTSNGDNGTITYTRRFEEYPKYEEVASVSDDREALPNNVASEIEQITKYGGFYIGRYEAGVPANQTIIDGTNKEKSNVEGVPVVKKNATVWTIISYDNAMPNAKKLYENSTSVRSGIVTGTQWDTVCAWIESENDDEGKTLHSVTDSTTWGNYKDSLAPADVTGYGEKQVAGYSEYWKAKNIYDLAGNTWEWTGEIYSTYRIGRGGRYNNVGSSDPASYRSFHGTSYIGTTISFRISLYVM